jgi:DNA-directed RNA polymerase subunit RPC12/RpoP
MALRVGPWGARPQARAADAADLPAAPERQLTCEQCAAVLAYKPGTDTVVCEYCGHANRIAPRPVEIVEQDLRDALARGLAAAPVEEATTVKCASCGAEFTFDPNRHAGACPFCGQTIVAGTGAHRQIKPAAVLPFAIEEGKAQEQVRGWLKKLWFAPAKLKAFGRTEGRLAGMYLPYWTYDSRTETAYAGQRGTIYHEPVQVRAMVKGRSIIQTRMVQKVRWRPVRGRVGRVFDDVLVLASRSLPAWLTDRLEPWDLQGLEPYAPDYLTGFQSEAYQVPLDEGFAVASEKMRALIQQDVMADIGGDVQRVERMDIRHHDPTFKHVLLPVWLGALRYGGKSYRLCVNGRTGEVQGERPYSVWKVLAAVVLALVILGLVAYLMAGSGLRLG